MKIVVAVRCYNESRHIERFLQGYDFADEIVISDGGSEDDSVSKIMGLSKNYHPKIHLFHYTEYEIVNGQRWNPDAGHMNFVLDRAKELDPDWLIFDDMDDVPNFHLHKDSRVLLESFTLPQVNAFRLYLWGNTGKFFPHMNRNFHEDYRSLWAWKPKELDIKADKSIRHGTLVGMMNEPAKLNIPYCLLHKSWYPEAIEAKIERYNALGLPMNELSTFAGEPVYLPPWGYE